MMKKLLALLLAALLIPCLALATDYSGYLIPEQFAGNFNDCVSYIVDNATREAVWTADQGAVITSGLRLSYTEAEPPSLYYNNPSWSLEASFYFENGSPDIYSLSEAMNLVLKGLDDQSRTVALSAFAMVLADDAGAYLDPLLEWLYGHPSEGQLYDLGSDAIYVVHSGDYEHYAVMDRARLGQ